MADVEELANVFHALSDPLRLRLMGMLPPKDCPKPICVCDLAKELGVSQPNVSHHLKVLRSAGLIRCQRSGGYAYYHVHAEGVKSALERVSRELTPAPARVER